jgi:sulfur-carrier protein
MAVTIRLPGHLKTFAAGQRFVEVPPSSVAGALRELGAKFPSLGQRVLDESGAPRRFVNVYLNGEDVRLLQGQETPLSDGDELIIAPAVAGGA